MRVLIAEDDATSRRLLEVVLARLGHDCDVAEDGRRAWELYERMHPDVLITDWMMPGLDGTELCRRIREHPGGYCYVILLTALGGQGHLLSGMRAGADDYMTKPLNLDQLEARLVAASRVCALHKGLAEREAELERLNARLLVESRRDELTGIGNRLALHENLEALDARARRYGHAYSLALCDLDRFKAYNDGLGHLAGDRALRNVAQTLAEQLRSGDSAFRFGGEEIALVLAEQTEQTALIALERMRESVAALAIEHEGNPPTGVVTISAGVASDRGRGSDDVIGRADAALYRAKAAGRNRVIVDSAGVPPPAR